MKKIILYIAIFLSISCFMNSKAHFTVEDNKISLQKIDPQLLKEVFQLINQDPELKQQLQQLLNQEKTIHYDLGPNLRSVLNNLMSTACYISFFWIFFGSPR